MGWDTTVDRKQKLSLFSRCNPSGLCPKDKDFLLLTSGFACGRNNRIGIKN